jgi:hypothetical protein
MALDTILFIYAHSLCIFFCLHSFTFGNKRSAVCFSQ